MGRSESGSRKSGNFKSKGGKWGSGGGGGSKFNKSGGGQGHGKQVYANINSNRRHQVPSYKEKRKAIDSDSVFGPGECYRCGQTGHSRKECTNQPLQRSLRKPCFACRRFGHTVADCPDKHKFNYKKAICYNCGKDTHALRDCPEPKIGNGTQYASCFICSKEGHLSRDCPQGNGLYPTGGGCRKCGKTDHLVRDCRGRDKSAPAPRTAHPEDKAGVTLAPPVTGGAEDDDYTDSKAKELHRAREEEEIEKAKKKKKKAKVVKF